MKNLWQGLTTEREGDTVVRIRRHAAGPAAVGPRVQLEASVWRCDVVDDGGVSPRVSLYEVLRARHVSMRQVVALGLDVEDLGAPVGVAARRAGVSPDRLASTLGATPSVSAVRQGVFSG